MNDELSSQSAVNPGTPANLTQSFFADPSKVLAAAADPARWVVLRELAGGQVLNLQELAAKAGRTANQMGKHLAVLRAAGLVQAVPSPDGDERRQCHAVPAAFRGTDAAGRLMLDYGVCRLCFGDDVRETVSPTAKD